MRSYIVGALVSLSLVAAVVDVGTLKRVTTGPPVVPNAYIVQLDTPGALGRRSIISVRIVSSFF